MIYSTDIGSLPKPKDFDENLFMQGLHLVENSILFDEYLDLNQHPVDYFSDTIVNGLLIKLRAGIERPCYPQYQDMVSQFINLHRKFMNSTVQNPVLEIKGRRLYNPKYLILPEVKILKEKAPTICQEIGIDQLELKYCISDFLTVNYAPKEGKVDDDFIAGLFAGNIVNTQYFRTQVAALDAPLYGLGWLFGRDILSRYEKIFEVAKLISPTVETSIHIHTSSQKDFLLIKNLDLIELHAKHIESTNITREDLENPDYNKKLQVGIAQTINPDFVESKYLMLKKGMASISKFGLENILYFSTECGMGGWSSLEKAVKNLQLVAETTRKINNEFS
jgi:hypothetical protein